MIAPLSPFSRRTFLHGLGAGLTLGALGPVASLARASVAPRVLSPDDHDDAPRALIVLQLAGGWDAHDLFVPYHDDGYHHARPTLARSRTDLLTLDSGLHLHRSAAPLERFANDGQLALIPQVGYADPSPSHYRSTQIWQSASGAGEILASGWLGRASIALQSAGRSVAGFYATASAPRIFAREDGTSSAQPLASAGGSWPDALAEIAERAGSLRPAHATELYFVSVPGFDTHYAQADTHDRLFARLASSLAALQQRLTERGVARRVVTMAFSEFGRTLAENHQGGTEHAASGTVMLLGSAVRGHDLLAPAAVADDSAPAKTDFRAVYANMTRDWLRVDPLPIVRGEFVLPTPYPTRLVS